MKYIKQFDELTLADTPLVGGKNSSLGQMISQLTSRYVEIPRGFAITADAYWKYLHSNNFMDQLKTLLVQIVDYQDISRVQKTGRQIRELLLSGNLPEDLKSEIAESYKKLSELYGKKEIDVAVRSSATAEDLPTASFAGQQETYLNICGIEQLLLACKKCMASLFTDRAIVYRYQQGFDDFQVALSIGVQKMVRSDLASAGVAFSLDTESGFREAIAIDSSYGLGETLVKGLVTPDEFVVFKTTLEKGYKPIIKKKLGHKQIKLIYTNSSDDPVAQVAVPQKDRQQFSLTDEEILFLGHAVLEIEHHYSKLKNKWCPMDIEWAKDGIDNKIYILQARPETVHANAARVTTISQYHIKNGDEQSLSELVLVTGNSIGQQITSGKARIIKDASEIDQIQPGDIIVTDMTDPDWVPAMKRAAGIVTNRGGRTCHAAIVSRELGIPAVVGTQHATMAILNGSSITLDCSKGLRGFVYKGIVDYSIDTIELATIPKPPVSVRLNIAQPDNAFTASFLPTDGVGLARIEFIISNAIKAHPLAFIMPEKITDETVKKQLDDSTVAYKSKKEFFIDTLSQGIGMIGAAFYPRPVLVRFSDFKSNEYRNLLGGNFFEPQEENPMIGIRGAFRYCNEHYAQAFALECAAIRKVRETMGLINVAVMLPFVRVIEEAVCVLDMLKKNGIERGKNGLHVFMMCEVPANAIDLADYCNYFDGFSIGSNDLTQLALGVDRDQALLAPLFDERNSAVKKLMAHAISAAHVCNKEIGICGQAPADYKEIADFLIEQGIDYISIDADSVLPFLMRYAKKP